MHSTLLLELEIPASHASAVGNLSRLMQSVEDSIADITGVREVHRTFGSMRTTLTDREKSAIATVQAVRLTIESDLLPALAEIVWKHLRQTTPPASGHAKN